MNRPTRWTFCALIAVGITGIGAGGYWLQMRQQSLPVVLGPPPLKSYRVGEDDEAGHFIFYTFGEHLPVALKTDHGFMLFNDGDANHFKPRWIFASSSERRVHVFKDVRELKELIPHLPKGTSINLYDKCQVPTFQDSVTTGKAGWKSIEEVFRHCRRCGLKVPEQRIIVYTCGEFD